MKKNGQGIVAAILIMVIASVAAVTVVSLLGTDLGSSLNYLYSQQAFFIAEGGLEYYAKQLQNQPSSWVHPPAPPTNAALGKGTFSIATANAQAHSIDVTSTGRVSGMDGISVVRVVREHLTRASGVFKYVVRSDSKNKGINFSGTSVGAVTGDLSSAGPIAGIPNLAFTLSGTKYPNAAMSFPAVDFSGYQAIADHVINTNFTFSAFTTYTGIYYINGNVTFQSGARLNGTLIVPNAGKDITLNSTVNVVIDPTADPLHPSSNYPAIVSAGKISANTCVNLTVKRLIYTSKNSNPSITLQSNVNVFFTGSIISSGAVDATSNVNLFLTFDPNILSNPPPYFSAGATQGVAASDWDELY